MNRSQRKRVGEALLIYKESAGRTWTQVSEDIEGASDIVFSDAQLSKLAKGVPHRDPILRSRAIREYPIPVGGEAIVRFVTEPGSPGFALPREELLAPVELLAPHSLVAFFAQSGQAYPFPPDAIAGTYEAIGQAALGEMRWALALESTASQGLLGCEIGASTAATNEGGGFRSTGWAVLSPDGHVLVIAHDGLSGENYLWTAITATPSLRGFAHVEGLQLGLHPPCGDAGFAATAASSTWTLAFARSPRISLPT